MNPEFQVQPHQESFSKKQPYITKWTDNLDSHVGVSF